jgi:hypothetical protein
VLKDIHQDYTKLQGTYTKTSQELAEYRGQVQALQQMVQQFQQQPQAQPQQPQVPVDPEKVKEDFMNRFYDDPLGAIQELVSKSVEPAINPIKQMVEPITKERQLQEQIQQVSGKFSDFNDMVPAIQQLINEMPQLAEQGLETLYYVAKGRSAQTAQPAPTPEQLIQDPNFVQQYVLNNPNIQQQMISNYVNQRQQTNQQTPVVMAGHPGGQPPAMPEQKPKTIGEGSKAFRKFLGL